MPNSQSDFMLGCTYVSITVRLVCLCQYVIAVVVSLISILNQTLCQAILCSMVRHVDACCQLWFVQLTLMYIMQHGSSCRRLLPVMVRPVDAHVYYATWFVVLTHAASHVSLPTLGCTYVSITVRLVCLHQYVIAVVVSHICDMLQLVIDHLFVRYMLGDVSNNIFIVMCIPCSYFWFSLAFQ